MKKIITVSIVGTVILLIIFSTKPNASKPTGSDNPVQDSNVNIVFEAKENREGSVIVTVTPKSLTEFEISLNTHSEELDMDMVEAAELIDDQGRVYNPISWEGAPAGGHHREGILKFNPIPSKSKSIELKIKNIGGVPERSFKWDL